MVPPLATDVAQLTGKLEQTCLRADRDRELCSPSNGGVEESKVVEPITLQDGVVLVFDTEGANLIPLIVRWVSAQRTVVYVHLVVCLLSSQCLHIPAILPVYAVNHR